MSVSTLDELQIGDKVTATPSWSSWLHPLAVVAIEETDGTRNVSIRRSEDGASPTYDLVAEGRRVACYGTFHDRPYRRLGTVRNLRWVGEVSLTKHARLVGATTEEDRPKGDDTWKRYYGGESA